MPTLSKITLTFNQDIDLDGALGFQVYSPPPQFIFTGPGFRWVSTRLGPSQVAVAAPTATPGERSAINFKIAFEIDYNATDLYIITRSLNVVVIICKVPTVIFSDFFSVDNYISGGDNAKVTHTIEANSATYYKIDSLDFLPATENPVCTHYKVSILTSLLADRMTGTKTIPSGNLLNPVIFEMPKGQGFQVDLHTIDPAAASNNTSTGAYYTNSNVPGVLNSSIAEIQILNSPTGATATIIITKTDTFALEYSLDGVTWVSTNSFPGLLAGTYTARVRDLFGCVLSMDFLVQVDGLVEGYLEISDSLSIDYSKRETVDNCGVYQNDVNSLSSEDFAADPDLVYMDVQRFQSCDSPVTQFKSSFDTHDVKVIRENGSLETMIVNKMTTFIGIKDSRDAFKYNLGGGLTGIYFTAGNLYDYDTNSPTGESFALNGGLPEWGYQIGNYLSIGSNFHKIESIIFDENLESDVIVINSAYLGSPTPIVVKSIFNRQKYDVFEFTTPLAGYADETIRISIEASRSGLSPVSYLSELICVKPIQKNTVAIEYFNDSNTDIFYKTGIKNILRIPIEFIKGAHEDASENTRGDDTSVLTLSEVYVLNEFVMGPVTKKIYWKIVKALSHKFITMNGEGYIKPGSIEKEGPIEESNLYIVTAKMLKTKAPFKSLVTSIDPVITDVTEALEIPQLIINNNGGFISHE